MGKVTVTTEDRLAPDASRRLGRLINEVKLPERSGIEVLSTYDKQTHKASEPKNRPRSYRLSISAEKELKAILATLGITNSTTGVEACIHAAAERLNIN